MATPPLPAAITDKIKSRSQSVRWTAILKEVREFRAYTCSIDADIIMGVSVPPVPIADLSPNPICLGSAMAWDISGSYAPGSTVSTYAIDFGDSNSSAAQSGNHTYAAAGEYYVEVTITSAAGLVSSTLTEVNVIDCSSPLFLNSIYASVIGSGVYYWE